MKLKGLLDFSINTNPLGTPLEIENAIIECCIDKTYTRYPDYNYTELRKAIAYFYGDISPYNIVPSNGAAEALNMAITALKPRTLVIISPGYGDGDYELLCRSLGIKCVHHVMSDTGSRFMLDTARLLEEVVRYVKPVIVLSNPNNPTGTVVPARELLELAENLRDRAYLVVDEAYAELSSSYTGLLGSHIGDNVVVVRSFTKVFSIPGLRIGFLYSTSKRVLERVEGLRQPWNINAIAECSLKKAFLNSKDVLWKYVKGSQAFISLERADLSEKLRAIGYHVYESYANFLLLRHDRIDALDLYHVLLRSKRILVRPAHTFHGLTRHYTRISIRRKWENQLLVKALAEAMGKQ